MAQVTDNTRLFRGQGQVFLAPRTTTGKPNGFTFVGNVSSLMLNPQTEKIEHTESQTGNNSIDKVIERSLNVEMTMTIDSAASRNLARMVFGTVTEEATATVTEEEIIAYKGKGAILDRINLTTFAGLTDETGATTYVEGTDYSLDLPSGYIQFLDTATFADGDTVKANYEAGESEIVSAFSSPNQEYWLRFNGLNTAENYNPVIIDCFKVRFAPANDIPMINDEDFAEYEQSGNALFDRCQPVNGKLGRYFSVRQLAQSDVIC